MYAALLPFAQAADKITTLQIEIVFKFVTFNTDH